MPAARLSEPDLGLDGGGRPETLISPLMQMTAQGGGQAVFGIDDPSCA
jgi:hypothetical protein